MATCKSCGREVPPGTLTCECGAKQDAGMGIGLPAFHLEGAPKPNLDFSLPSQSMSQVPGLETIDVSRLGLDFNRSRDRGRTYRPVFAAGQREQAANPLRAPFGLAWLPDNTFYAAGFSDEGGSVRVQCFDGATGALIRTVREFEESSPDAPDTPAGIAADCDLNFYIVDTEKCRVGKYDPAGKLLAFFGAPGTGASELADPRGVAVGADGSIYISDTGNNRVLRWDAQGRFVFAYGINKLDEENGWMQSGSEPGEFDEPAGIALDRAGNLYVADGNNHRVQKFSSSGKFETAFGEEGDQAGKLQYPAALRVGMEGSVLVCDMNGSRIQRFDGSGHFMYELMFPVSAGSVSDFEIDPDDRLLVTLRRSNAILKLEVA